jgi:hypothetical protein
MLAKSLRISFQIPIGNFRESTSFRMTIKWDEHTPNRRLDPERVIVRKLLGDFQIEGSRGKKFADQFDTNGAWPLQSLVILALSCSYLTGLKFPRNSRRNRALVYKWFDDNCSVIEPVCTIARFE